MISSQDTVVSLSEIVPVQASVGSVLTVLSGSSIVITCSADGFPTPSVAWTKGEQLIHKSNELTIVNATESDSGDYLCTAMSEIGSDQESTKITVMGTSCNDIRELKHATFLNHGRQLDVSITHARTMVSPRFSN